MTQRTTTDPDTIKLMAANEFESMRHVTVAKLQDALYDMEADAVPFEAWAAIAFYNEMYRLAEGLREVAAEADEPERISNWLKEAVSRTLIEHLKEESMSFDDNGAGKAIQLYQAVMDVDMIADMNSRELVDLIIEGLQPLTQEAAIAMTVETLLELNADENLKDEYDAIIDNILTESGIIR